jgi:putative redox protein
MALSVKTTSTGTPWRVDIGDGVHQWHADEPKALGGQNTAPNPAQMICGALGACTVITVQMYAARKQWPLAAIEVVVTKEAAEFERRITLHGELDAEQRARLLEIANKCPTHKLLTGTIHIATQLA